MATEIERKFLVEGKPWRDAMGTRIIQGYLSRDKHRTVRVRVRGEQAFITIKSVTQGATRAEFEYDIPRADAEQLLKLCDGPIIEKNRHVIEHQGAAWEVDEFLGDNAGLVIAEIELQSEQQPFSRPDWLGKEVTDDRRYYNSNLASQPYRRWRGAGGQQVPTHPQPGKYRHYKGNDYEVLGTASHSETGEELVVYRALYGDRGLWVRPAAMFCESVRVGNDVVPRFAYVGSDPEALRNSTTNR